jgi:transposase
VIAASVPDPSVFKSGRDFTAWLGLTMLPICLSQSHLT